jgi:glycosyl transferase family 25
LEKLNGGLKLERMKTAFRIISLANSPRRQLFHRPPDNLQLDWSFIDASTSTAEGVSINEKLWEHHMNRSVVQGEIGCFSSHVRAWRELLADPLLDQIVVIEDDVFVDWVRLERIGKVDWHKLNVDYLKLYAQSAPTFRLLRRAYPVTGHHIVQYTKMALGTQAYLLTRSAAERFERLLNVMSRPIDNEMDRPWGTGVPVMGLSPSPVIELSLPSEIENRELDQRRRPLSHLIGRTIERARGRAYRWFAPSVRIP